MGVLQISPAFAPVLARNGGGAFLTVASIAGWISSPMLASYAVSKSVLWSLGSGLRNDLLAQGTQVLTLHIGFVETDLTRGIETSKAKPETIVDRALTALEAGAAEVLADELTQQVAEGFLAAQAVHLAVR